MKRTISFLLSLLMVLTLLPAAALAEGTGADPREAPSGEESGLVARFEVTTPVEFIENYGGYLEKDGGEPWYRYFIFPSDYTYAVTFTEKGAEMYNDGKLEFTGTGAALYTQTGHEVNFGNDQWSRHWTVAGENFATVSFLGKEITIPVTVRPSPVESIALTAPVEFIEHTGGQWNGSGNGRWYSYYIDPEDYTYAVTFTKEGAEKYNNGNTQFVGSRDALRNLTGYGVDFYADQENTHWTVGGENRVTLSILGKEITIPVTVQPSPIESFSLTTPVEFIENCGGRLEKDGGEPWYRYFISPSDYTYAVTFTEEGAKKYNGGNREFTGTGTALHIQTGHEVNFGNDQWSRHWTVAGENFATVSFLGKKITIPVTVRPSPVESIALAGPIEFFENCGGWWNGSGDGRWYSYHVDPEDYTYAVTFTKEGAARYNNGNTQFVGSRNALRKLTGYGADFYADQENTHWTVDGENRVTLSILGKQIELPVTVRLSPIESFSLTAPVEFFEHDGGWWNDSSDGRWYCYYISPYDYSYKVTFTKEGAARYNGGKTQFVGSSNELHKLTGCEVSFHDDQWSSHWEVGRTYTVTANLMGRELPLEVPIVPSPVESFAVNTASLELVENGSGYWQLDENRGSWFFYEPDFRNTLQYTVTFTKEGAEKYNGGNREFTGSGPQLDEKFGSWVKWNSEQSPEDIWLPGRSYTATASFMGREAAPSSIYIKSGTRVDLTAESFPDRALRDYLTERYDPNRMGHINQEQVQWIYCDGVADVTGLQAFTDLQELVLNNGTFAALDASPFTKLAYLEVTGNKNLTRITFGKDHRSLERLSLENNQLKTLDVTHLPALRDIYCWNNQLKTLDVSGNKELESLNCSNNLLTDLNVSGCTKLELLLADQNQLSALNVSQSTALRELSCGGNRLTALNLTKNTALEVLDCWGNQLKALDVSRNKALEVLGCGSNLLTALNVSQSTALRELSCGGNRLTDLNVSQNTALQRLGCGSNLLTALNLDNNTALEALDCGELGLTQLDISRLTALKQLWCYDNRLTALDTSRNTSLRELYCWSNPLNTLDVSRNTALNLLDCDQCGSLQKITLGQKGLILTTEGCPDTLEITLVGGGKPAVLQGTLKAGVSAPLSMTLLDAEGKAISAADELSTDPDRPFSYKFYAGSAAASVEFSAKGYVTHRYPVADIAGKEAVLLRRGDVNGAMEGDGNDIGTADMQCLYEYLSAEALPDKLADDAPYFQAVADCNNDGALDILDYQALYEMIRRSGVSSSKTG